MKNNTQTILLEKIFKDENKGIFMDVGCYDGINRNHTYSFYNKSNWKGICIEPNKDVFCKLMKNRPKSSNINAAIDNKHGMEEFYKCLGYTEYLSGLKKYYNSRFTQRRDKELALKGGFYETETIKVHPISLITEKLNIEELQFIALHCNCGEFPAIKSIDFDNVFIHVIFFEDNYADITENIVLYLQEKDFSIIKRVGGDVFMINNKSKYKKNI